MMFVFDKEKIYFLLNFRMRILHQQNQQKNRDQQQQMMNKTRTAPNITTVDKPSTNIPKELTTEDLRDFYCKKRK